MKQGKRLAITLTCVTVFLLGLLLFAGSEKGERRAITGIIVMLGASISCILLSPRKRGENVVEFAKLSAKKENELPDWERFRTDEINSSRALELFGYLFNPDKKHRQDVTGAFHVEVLWNNWGKCRSWCKQKAIFLLFLDWLTELSFGAYVSKRPLKWKLLITEADFQAFTQHSHSSERRLHRAKSTQ